MNNQNSFIPKTASYFRARGREALKGNWGIAIGAMLLASLLGAFVAGKFFDVDLDDLGIRSRDLANPAFYTMENLRAILSQITESAYSKFLFATALFSAFTSIAWCLFLGSPVFLGYEKFQLDLIDRKPLKIKTLFEGFKTCYIKSVLLRVLLALISLACALPTILAGGVAVVLCLPAVKAFVLGEAMEAGYYAMIGIATLLLSIGSIATSILTVIITLRYEFAFAILAEYPELSATEALQKSATLMRGNKWRLFCLELSFIGWYLLSACFTCGIGFIWAIPYRNASVIAFYDEVANRKAATEAEFPSLDPDDYTSGDQAF